MTTKTFDVVIVGAGPAGTSAAIVTAQSGLRVALLDKATFPRDKTCGDALSVDVMNQLGMLSEALVADFEKLENKTASYGVKIFSPDNNCINIPFISKNANRCGYVSPRMHFDNLLFQHTRSFSNITIYESCSVIDVTMNNSQPVLQTSEGTFTGKMVIGADGAHSIIAKLVGDKKVEKAHYSAGLRVYYDGVTGFNQGGYIELHFFKDILPGYLWIFPLPDNKANVGIGVLSSVVSKKKINLKETLQNLLSTQPHIAERFKNAKPLETIKGYGLPLGSKKRNLSGEGVLLVGDAAALIDPFTGEGIANAIRSGRVAAKHVIAAFENKNFTSAFNKAYDREIYRRMLKEFEISRTLQHLVKYPGLLNFAIRRAGQSKYFQKFLVEVLADVEIKKRFLLNPLFYYRIFFN